MQFFLGAKSQSSTRHMWELRKLYTIIEFIFCLTGHNKRGLNGHIFTHICAQEKSQLAASEHRTRKLTISSLMRYL